MWKETGSHCTFMRSKVTDHNNRTQKREFLLILKVRLKAKVQRGDSSWFHCEGLVFDIWDFLSSTIYLLQFFILFCLILGYQLAYAAVIRIAGLQNPYRHTLVGCFKPIMGQKRNNQSLFIIHSLTYTFIIIPIHLFTK